MLIRIPFIKECLLVTLICGLYGGTGFSAVADSTSETTTLKERHHENARIFREQSVARARSKLGYETTSSELNFNRTIDFFALGEQIKQLGALIQKISPSASKSSTLLRRPLESIMPSISDKPSQEKLRSIYGPDGPTEKSVRLILEYRLMIAGNPRLKIGDVQAEENMILASVVTKDGSLVEKFEINKSTGAWFPIRN